MDGTKLTSSLQSSHHSCAHSKRCSYRWHLRLTTGRPCAGVVIRPGQSKSTSPACQGQSNSVRAVTIASEDHILDTGFLDVADDCILKPGGKRPMQKVTRQKRKPRRLAENGSTQDLIPRSGQVRYLLVSLRCSSHLDSKLGSLTSKTLPQLWCQWYVNIPSCNILH